MFGLIPRKEKEKVGYPLTRLQNEFKALYDRLFGAWPMLFEPPMEPETFWGFELENAEKELVVRAELPGFELEELNLELRKNLLIIKAEKKPVEEKKGVEVPKRFYERVVELPVEVEPTKVVATYRNGMLEVHLPKTEEAKGLHIPVK
jgi:HSP20 family protein